MQRYARISVWILWSLSALLPAAAESLDATTRRGATIGVIAEFPPGPGPFAAVVLAPGQAYPMHAPALEQTAHVLLAHGIAVYRFDWAYVSTSGTPGIPSANLVNEREDFAAVLALAQKNPRIKKTRISVGGKSLGSVVAWRAFEADPTLRSAILLTPICGQSASGEVAERNYSGFSSEHRPVFLISGNRDPLCASAVLQKFAAGSGGAARVEIAEGDHGFENPDLSGSEAETALDRTIQSVAARVASFAIEVSKD